MTKNTGTWLVFEGDWGGQIYLTVPSHLVGEEAHVSELLMKLDAFAWDCNEGDGCSTYEYDPASFGGTAEDGVSGGMGGGELRDGLWLHEEFRNGPWEALAKQFLLLPD